MLRSLTMFSCLVSGLGGLAHAQMVPDWTSTISAGGALSAGIQGSVVNPAGVTFVTGVAGSSSNTNVITAAFGSDGALLWSDQFNGVGNWHDQGRAIALAPGGIPGAGSYADILLLKYDAASGTLLNTVQYTTAPFTSEAGYSVATDALGNVFVGAGTNGDGPDTMLVKFDSVGVFQWSRTWDGPAYSPYSQDSIRQVEVDPSGDVVVMIHGVMSSLHPDYVVIKYSGTDGTVLWESNWGITSGDFAQDMVISPGGDIFVTGSDSLEKISTVKFRGSDGQVEWQEYDSAGFDNYASAVALDAQGDVLIAGTFDPDGDDSNSNDNILVVKRDGNTGAQLWTFTYGDNCNGCLDAASDVLVDPTGLAYVAGTTSSPPYGGVMILFALDAATGVEASRGTASGVGAGQLGFDAASNIYCAGGTRDWTTGAVEISAVRFPGPDLPTTNYCTAAANSTGSGAIASASGSVSVSANSLTLSASPVPAEPGVFFYGPSQIQVPFGNGFRCVGGSVVRLPITFATGGALTRPLDLTQLPAGSVPIAAGSTWNFQAWFRDPAAGGWGFNLSDGLEIVFAP